ncbi:MAG TPA: restriction endonuclease [Rhodanobacteraceae bacterium]|nr:restriction endonuclease [Rhodanobacteraceae bacterium]
MAIPDYQTLMRPLLELCRDGQPHRFGDLVEFLANEFQLTEVERTELLPSGRYPTFRSRVGWAKTYLKQAGLLEQPGRALVRITERGAAALRSGARIGTSYLEQFKEFQAFQGRARVGEAPESAAAESASGGTPDEILQHAFEELRSSLINEVHDALLRASPAFFERAVIDLLRAMGYGGTVEDAGTLLGSPGDGGVDGAIKEDKLGLDTVYVQAKKWAADRTVGDAEIRNFIGALQLHRARKGVFFTTSDFSKTARASAARSDSRVVLINGTELAALMVEHDVGVSVTSTLQLKKLDSDYFED